MNTALEELLLRDGILTQSQMTTAVEDARRTQKSLAETVIDLGFIDERRFANWIAEASGTPLVDPLPEQEVERLERRVPPATARLRMALPVGEQEGTLLVALTNPMDAFAIQALRSTTSGEITPVTGIRSAIERLVNRFYPEQIDGDATLLPRASFNFDRGEAIRQPWDELPPAEPMEFTEATRAFQVPPAPPAPSAENAPFDFSSETLLSSRRSLNLEVPPRVPDPEEKFGTLVAEPLPESAMAPVDPLARIEHRLDEIAGAIERLQRRLDALDMTLMKVLNR